MGRVTGLRAWNDGTNAHDRNTFTHDELPEEKPWRVVI